MIHFLVLQIEDNLRNNDTKQTIEGIELNARKHSIQY